MRFEVLSSDKQQPALQVLLARSSSPGRKLPARDAPQLRADDLETLGEVLLACADVMPTCPVSAYCGRTVDAVGHSAVLANLLEQTRRRGAAEDRVEEREGVAPLVAAGDARAGEHDVVLLSCVAQKA